MAVTKAILEKWMVAQKRHRLSDKQVQMARELGLNPDKLGKIDNHKQEPWKAPLPQFIEHISANYPLCDTLGNGCFTNARFAYKAWVVLLTS